MRIAFAANPALGHVLPLLPLALAARGTGHEVAFVGGASLTATLAAFDLPHVVAGPPDLPAVFEAIDAARLQGPRLAVAVWSLGFAEVVARPMAHGLLELSRSWRPDVVVHEDTEQGTWPPSTAQLSKDVEPSCPRRFEPQHQARPPSSRPQVNWL